MKELYDMKYTFSFTEINTGSIEIEADSTPTRADVIEAIENGSGFYKDTEYGEILLVDPNRHNRKKKIRNER
jgi:hypothetical protein